MTPQSEHWAARQYREAVEHSFAEAQAIVDRGVRFAERKLAAKSRHDPGPPRHFTVDRAGRAQEDEAEGAGHV